MILGLGTDLVEVDRVRASLDRFGERFLLRVFTPGERAYAAAKRCPEQHLAAGVGWREFEVTRSPEGAPRLVLHGRALASAAALGVERTSLSLTHTDRYAFAVVVFEGPNAATW